MSEYTNGQRLTMQAMRPPKRNKVCENLVHISQLVTDPSTSFKYCDTYYKCTKLNQRLSKRGLCHNCIYYKPLKRDEQ